MMSLGIRDAEEKIKATAAVLKGAEENFAEADRVATERNSDLATARTRLEESENAYVNKPSDATGKKVVDARAAAHLAGLLAAPATARREVASAALETARSAHATACAELEREKKLAALRKRADIETLHDAVRPQWQMILQAIDAIHDAATAIEAARDDSHAASQELTQLGVLDARPLDAVHVAYPLLESLVDRGIHAALHEHYLNTHFRYQLVNSIHDGVTNILARILLLWKRHPPAGLPPEKAQRELAILGGARTIHDAAKIRLEIEKQEEQRRKEYPDEMHSPLVPTDPPLVPVE